MWLGTEPCFDTPAKVRDVDIYLNSACSSILSVINLWRSVDSIMRCWALGLFVLALWFQLALKGLHWPLP